MQKLIPFLCLFFLFSCTHENKTSSDEENVAGGPCSYNEEYFPIKILDIDSTSEDDCELTLLKIVEEDTIYYSHYNPNLLELKELNKNKIKVGDTITFVEMNIQTGSCNPFIQTVSIDKFNSKLNQ